MATFRFQPSSYSVCEGSSRTVYVQLQTEGVLDQAVRVTVRTVSSGTATGTELFVKEHSKLKKLNFQESTGYSNIECKAHYMQYYIT